MNLFIIVFFFCLGTVFPELFHADNSTASAPANTVMYSIIGSCAFAVFEAFCLCSFGTTLAKYMYGISIRRMDEERISFMAALQRSLAVSFRGLAVGLPLILLITLARAYKTLKKERHTSWDRDFKWMTIHRELSVQRWLAIVIAWAVLLSIYILLIAAGSGAFGAAPSFAPTPAYPARSTMGSNSVPIYTGYNGLAVYVDVQLASLTQRMQIDTGAAITTIPKSVA
jgi:hypothetical protein